MLYQTYNPISPLSRFVETIWFISNGPADPPRHLVCPHGLMEMVIQLDDRKLSMIAGDEGSSVRGPLLAGPYSKAFFIDPSEFTAVLGVRFKPGAARLFFPIPAHQLHNIDIPLGDAYPSEAEQLRNELLTTRGLDRKVQVLQRYLLGKLAKAAPLDPLVEHAVRQFRRQTGFRAVADVQSEVGLSHTRFNQIFRENVGMTPKLFCRVQRFQAALQSMESGPRVNWAEVAAGCGYFDQAHLIRDFREFAGLTPLAYAGFQQANRRHAAAVTAR